MGEGLENEEAEELGMVKKCYFCQGRVHNEEITVDYRWGSTLVIIRGVPAGVCHQCGERYIESGVYKGMESLAKNKSHVLGKMSVDVLQFEGASANLETQP
jgi:YgiT-type zinc finger domain-containing protein